MREIAQVINRNGLENESGTPDFIIAEFLVSCLDAYNNTKSAVVRYNGAADNVGLGIDDLRDMTEHD